MSDEILEQLQREIENAEGIDAEHAAQIETLKGSIQRGIAEPEHRLRLVEDLERSLILFAEDHPQLAAAMQAAINILAQSGV